MSSGEPGNAAQPWTTITLAGTNAYPVGAIACGSPQLCVAAADGSIWTSTDPASPSGWSSPATPPQITSESDPANSASCAGTSLCLVARLGGDVALVSSTPADPGSYAPRPEQRPVACMTGSTCLAESLNVHDDDGTRIVDSAPAGPGGAIAGVALNAAGTILRWTNAGQPRSLPLH